MCVEYGKIEHDVRLTDDLRLHGMVIGNVTVADGGALYLHGTISGDLAIESGGRAVLHGMVAGSVFKGVQCRWGIRTLGYGERRVPRRERDDKDRPRRGRGRSAPLALPNHPMLSHSAYA